MSGMQAVERDHYDVHCGLQQLFTQRGRAAPCRPYRAGGGYDFALLAADGKASAYAAGCAGLSWPSWLRSWPGRRAASGNGTFAGEHGRPATARAEVTADGSTAVQLHSARNADLQPPGRRGQTRLALGTALAAESAARRSAALTAADRRQ